MVDVKQHYATLLAPVYGWYLSLASDPVERAAGWLARHKLERFATYLDLGAGFGPHALALLRLNKRVTAVDFDATLLGEFRAAAAQYTAQLTLHEAELLAFLREAGDTRWDVILCVGDTLTHLGSTREVMELLSACARHLSPGGRVALAYRDSSAFAAEGVQRFLEVGHDAQRTMHCLLEPLDGEHLRVTDIVTEVGAEGPRTRLSDYVKLRLAPELVVGWAVAAGLALEHQALEAGMTTLSFRLA